MPKTQKQITIFYSWQTDLPKETNLNAIRNALKNAIKYKKLKEFDIVVDEATRDRPGSPDIPSTILEKIAACDVFIGDITTINKASGEPRKTANPNVLIELGYASGEVGWERIVMLFNRQHGDFPDDVAFDIDRRRISPFSVSGEADLKGNTSLEELLIKAIKSIIKHNPSKPFQKKQVDSSMRKRQHDLLKLKFLLSYVNTPVMDIFFQTAPGYINSQIFHFFESYRGIVLGSGFFLYDKKTFKLTSKILALWTTSLSKDQYYTETSSSEVLKFVSVQGNPNPYQAKKDFEFLEKTINKLHKTYNKFLNRIRSDYLELDLNELNKIALQEYIDFKENG